MTAKNESRFRVPRKVYEFTFKMSNGDVFRCEAADLEEAMKKRVEAYGKMTWTIDFGGK